MQSGRVGAVRCVKDGFQGERTAACSIPQDIFFCQGKQFPGQRAVERHRVLLIRYGGIDRADLPQGFVLAERDSALHPGRDIPGIQLRQDRLQRFLSGSDDHEIAVSDRTGRLVFPAPELIFLAADQALNDVRDLDGICLIGMLVGSFPDIGVVGENALELVLSRLRERDVLITALILRLHRQ